MKSKPKQDILTELGSMADRNFDICTKVAIISFHNKKYSKYIEALILIIEYLQLISQIIFLAFEASIKDSLQNENPFIKGIFFVCHIFNPLHSLHRDSSNFPFVKVIFVLAICYVIVKHILFTYIILRVVYNVKQYNILIEVWRWIFKLQGRVLYFIFSSFWAGILMSAWHNNKNMFGISNQTIITFSICMIVIEYSNSFYFFFRYCYILPTKNFLAEKDNYMQLITLTQKLFLQILHIYLSLNPRVITWIFTSLCLIFDLVRNLHHFTRFPLYNIKALHYQGNLLMIVSSLNVPFFLQWVIKSMWDYHLEDFVWIIWVPMILVTIITSRIYLRRVIWNSVTSSKINMSPHLLIHKVNLMKQIRKMVRTPYEYNRNYVLYYTLYESINANIKKILNIGPEFSENIDFNIATKDSANKMFLHYFEYLHAKFTKSKIIKLYLAYFYAKKMKLYGKAIWITRDLQKFHGRLVRLNNSLLVYDIQNILSSRYEDPNSVINLSVYIKSQASYAQLRQKVINQIQLQMQICQEILNDSPRILEIMNWSQEIYLNKQKIEKAIKVMFEIIPDYFIEPLAFLAHYYLIVNHSISEALTYRQLYFRKNDKYKKFFNSPVLQQENAFQSQNLFMLFSGEKVDQANILFCSGPAEHIYGREAQFLVGKHASYLVTPSLQSFMGAVVKYRIENENQANYNMIVRTYSNHKEGHMVEFDYFVNVHPFIDGTFVFSSVLRKVPTSQEYLIISKDGNIEGATEQIREILDLKEFSQLYPKVTPHVMLLSKELNVVNMAMNKAIYWNEQGFDENDDKLLQKSTLKHEKEGLYQDIDTAQEEVEVEKAKSVYSLYTTEGEKIVLKSLLTKKSYLFHCKVLDIVPGSYQKLVVLQRKDENNRYEKLKNIDSGKKEVIQKETEVDADLNWQKSETENQSYFEEDPIKIASKSKAKQPLRWRQNITIKNIISEKLNTDFARKSTYQLLNTQQVQTEASNNLMTLTSPNLITERPLLKTEDDLPKTNRLIEEKEDDEVLNKFHRILQRAEESIEESRLSKDLKRHETSIAESRLSEDVKQIKLSNAYKAAITTKTCNNSFWVFCLLFYLILIVVFILQVYMRKTWEDSINTLKAKKDILNDALLRNFFIVDLPAFFTTAACLANGKIDLSPLGITPALLFDSAQQEIPLLAEINNVLLRNTNSLSEEIRQSLFYKDVRVFEFCPDCSEQPYMKLDNFQATNAVIESLLQLLPLAKSNITKAYDGMNLFSKNCLNDLSIKNTETAEIFLQFLNDQREEILTSVNFEFSITLALLAINALLMILSIFHHYFTETKNIAAVIRLDVFKVSHVWNKIKNFKEMVENQRIFEESLVNNFEKLHSFSKYFSEQTKSKKGFLKTADSKGLLKKYNLYLVRLILIMAILSGLVVWSTKTVCNFIDNVYEKQSQLYLVNVIRSRSTLAGHAISELLYGGPNRTIENMPILTFVSNSVNEIIDLHSRIFQVFPAKALEKNPLIQKILFEGSCDILTKYTTSCKFMTAHGVSPSYIQTLTTFENYLRDINEKFIRLNESEQSSFKPDEQDFNMFTMIFLVLTSGQSFLLIDKLDAAYESLLEDSRSQRNLILIIFTLAIAFLMVWFWLSILKQLKEIDNRFKRVLQVFPPSLILSNFHLKSFLIRTSNGTLDFIKNQVDHA